MYTYTYQILKLKLQTDVTELREIAWYTGQDNLGDKNSSIKAAPAAYLEFSPASVVNKSGQLIQSAVGQFDVILITECLLDDDKRIKKDAASDHMAIFDKIYKALHGFSAKLSYLPEFAALLDTDHDQRAFNSISRTGITPPHAPLKAIMRSVQRFQTKFYDHAAAMTYTTPSPRPPLGITVEFEIAHDVFDHTFDETFD